MEYVEEKEIQDCFLPVRVGNHYDEQNIYVVNVKKLLSMIDNLEERVEDLESQIRRMNY